MCGILGGWDAKKNLSTLKEGVEDSLSMMAHRGPDDAGYEILSNNSNGTTYLAHTRLSIIDLSASGHQPMNDERNRYSIVFNGEIYNYLEIRNKLIDLGYVFVTKTDTEVLLYAWIAWGEECLVDLVGMFAFVIYDKIEQTLTCVRDAFGIKPFYYEYNQERFTFCSELAPLLSLRCDEVKPNMQRAYDYLVHGSYDFDEYTFVEDIMHLKPGHLMVVEINERQGNNNIKKWWDASAIIENNNISFSNAKNLVQQEFLKSVRLHLRSDVQLGVALSGGIDSSSLVCAMNYLDPGINTKTFSYISEDPDISEEKWVNIVNSYTKSKCNKTNVKGEDLLSDLNDLVKTQGEPFGSTSIYAQYRVFKLARENGVTVTLDGQGADELLAGYKGYPGERILSLLESRQYYKAFSFAKRWSCFPGRSFKMASFALIRELLPTFVLKPIKWLLGSDSTPVWLDIDLLRKEGVIFDEKKYPKQRKFKGRRVIEKLSVSLQDEGLPQLLRHEDRNSMRFSVESRVPFLTIAMAELLLSLPEEYLISHSGETKHVFREAMRGIAPDEILDRKDKIGFATNNEDWLCSHAATFRKCIERSCEINFINTEMLLIEFDSMVNKKIKFSLKMWRWINYIIWYEQYVLSFNCKNA